MDIKKLLIGGVIGGIAFFLLGWLIYGILLKDFMASHPGIVGNFEKAEPDFLYLVIGNLAMGFMMAYIFIRSGISNMTGGAVLAAVVGLLMAVGYDCIMYSTTNLMSKTAMAADVAAYVVMSAVVGAIVGVIFGMGKKSA